MSISARRWLPVLALFAACALPFRPLAAGDTPGATDRDRAVAAALESANLRMRAKIEEAGILDRQGLHDEALAALRGVEGIHREGMVLVERLTATPTAPAAKRDPVVSWRQRIPLEVRMPATPVTLLPPTVVDRPEPSVAEAADYLLSMQRIDGWFRPGPKIGISTAAALDRADQARDIPTTALAVLALLDSLDGDEPSERTKNAVKLGVQALLGAQGDSGVFGDAKDLEAHALGTWAVASGVSHLGRASWKTDVGAALEKALAFSLGRRDERALWLAGTGSKSDDWIVSAWMAISLHEIKVLPASFAGAVDLGAELARAFKGARESDVVSGELNWAARFARALLAKDALLRSGDPLPRASDGETTLLLGTTYRFGRAERFPEWLEETLEPESKYQHHGGPFAGSWDPVGDRAIAHGRTYATACQLLAALVPLVDYREPLGD